MANSLTGDFDVVAEFALGAVNRLMAGMHQTERFLHAMSIRVDDKSHPRQTGRPTLVGVVDGFGDAIANQQQIGTPNPVPGASAASDPNFLRLRGILNPDLLANTPTVPPSNIQGVAQLQLFPPTVSVPTGLPNFLTVTTNIMVRFFPDKGTAPLAEFMRGDLEITVPMNKIASGRVHVLDIDFKAEDASINFTPSYSSQNLSPEDLAGINLSITNGLRTAFLPSSVILPSSVADVQLKTLPAVIAVLLDLNDHTPASTPASVTNVFLGSGDDFAFAVGRDYLLNTLRLISDNILTQQIPEVRFTFVGLHYDYPIKLNSAGFELQTGKIVLTIQGHAGPAQHTPHAFNFTVSVDFSLLPAANTVVLEVGNVSVTTDSTLAGIVDFFTSDITNSVKNAVSGAISATGANSMVNSMFNADTQLGNFLNSQFTPSDDNPPAEPQHLFLVYNSVDIQPPGIVLHGSLSLFDWPAPHVEFEQIPSNIGNRAVTIATPPDYSALKTWIPGGIISQYEWSVLQGEQAYPVAMDANRFVLLHSPRGFLADAAVPGYSPLCLTIIGSRISNSGPPVYQPVSASICGFTQFPVGGLVGVSTKGATVPTLAVTRPGPRGEVVASGHVSPEIDRTGTLAPNLIVHFADSSSAAQLPVLTRALEESKRTDAPTAIIAVLTPDQLPRAPYVPGVVYTDDQEAWLNALGVQTAKLPLTLIVGPRGGKAWQYEGTVEVDTLAAALSKHLVKRPPVAISMPRLNLRIGQPPLNFLFEFAPGREMPISKLEGPLALVFWKSSVKPSIQAVRDLQTADSKTTVLAVNDGDDPEVARQVAAESGFTAVLVTDPKREIALAYGVRLLPTTVTVASSGAVTGIKYGHVLGEQLYPPAKSTGSVMEKTQTPLDGRSQAYGR